MTRDICVTYDGTWPATCCGTLTIHVDGKEIYSKFGCCTSTGSVWIDSDSKEHIESGELVWDDVEDYDEDIKRAVESELENYFVCCGGCI